MVLSGHLRPRPAAPPSTDDSSTETSTLLTFNRTVAPVRVDEMSTVETDVLIIGAGSAGLGLAIQLKRKLGHEDCILIEKAHDVGGTWLVNTYPGCGCDVASHLYSYSFALKADWNRKYSLQPEIQAYFRKLAEDYHILDKIRFGSTVDEAVWQSESQFWSVSITNHDTGSTYKIRARALVSGVGGLSIPRPCEIPGHESFKGPLFHSAKWDNSFDWTDKEVVVVGNGCSATQFVPVITSSGPDCFEKSGPVKKVTQFSRQAHYLAERENPHLSNAFKAVMRYVPLAMRLYRLREYIIMEKDFAGFSTKGGQRIRDELAQENERYVKKVAPPKYWDHLIPRHQIGCKRKVLDTDYLACLWKDNMELVPDDPIDRIEEHGVVTRSGRFVKADAIALATGFDTKKMLFPMKIIGEHGISLEDHWNKTTDGAPAAYLGTVTSGFPNFAILMGPNTVTGHLSVIYTTECQILFTLGLLRPILTAKKQTRGAPTSVAVTEEAETRDVTNTHNKLKDLVWSSGCTSWALDPKTNRNITMYWHYQWHYYLRCLFLKSGDFKYTVADLDGEKGITRLREKSLIVGYGWIYLRRTVLGLVATAATAWAYREAVSRKLGLADIVQLLRTSGERLVQSLRG